MEILVSSFQSFYRCCNYCLVLILSTPDSLLQLLNYSLKRFFLSLSLPLTRGVNVLNVYRRPFSFLKFFCILTLCLAVGLTFIVLGLTCGDILWLIALHSYRDNSVSIDLLRCLIPRVLMNGFF